MYVTKSNVKNVSDENHQNIWEKYRPTATINFSDIVEDGTIYDHTRTEMTFGSIETNDQARQNERTSNEYEIDPDAVSVDDILSNSIVHEIRHLSQSKQGALSTSIRNHFSMQHSTSQFPMVGNDFSIASADFRPAEECGEQLNRDERSWEQVYADIPQLDYNEPSMSTATDTSRLQMPKPKGRLASFTDFSVAYLADSISGSNTDVSIGRFFQNRCGDLREIIPKTSPERHVPVPLVSKSFQSADAACETNSQATSSFFADDESNIKTAKMSSATYDKESSIINRPSVANTLEDEVPNILEQSPRTFLNKFYASKTKPLTKANVKKHEDTLCAPPSTNGMTTDTKQQLNQDYRKYEKYDQYKNSMDGMLGRMNSTKIGEQETQWRSSNGVHSSADTESAVESTIEESTFSPIKNQSIHRENTEKNKCKRLTSPKSHANELKFKANNPMPENENAENQYGQNKMTNKRVRSPTKEVLNDVSSIMLNNLRISSPNADRLALIEKCATVPNALATKNASAEEQRRYMVRNQSPDCSKLSLPNYGLQGIQTNYQDAVAIDRRCNSQLSTHSEFTQQDGKFPLKSNSAELVWECVKLRKSITKSFVIKNTSEKKLSLKIGVYGPGFQIASGADTLSLVLQGNECRTISVTFCPTIIGKAIGKVVFRPTKNWPGYTECSVKLWAYGGSTVLQLQGVERGPVGCSFLKMAESSKITSTTLKRTFSIYNKGPLNGVATIFIKPKTDQFINENNIIIQPNKCVIRPNCSTVITVTYKLRRRDLERLRDKSCEVLTIGTLEVIFGAEANRQRIASMLTRKGNIPSMYKQLQFMIDNFPVANSEHFDDFDEHIDNVSDLFGCFKTSEIALTINRTNLDESRDNDLTMEDSVMFRSMIEAPK